MTLTRKHFKELARIVRDARPAEVKTKEQLLRDWFCDEFMDDLVRFCKQENPRFDEDKFRAACERPPS